MSVVITRLGMGMERHFLVFQNEENEEVVGVLSQKRIEAAIKAKQGNLLVEDLMNQDFEIVDSQINLKALYQILQTKGISTLPVRIAENEIAKVDIHLINEYLQQQQGEAK